MNVLRISDLRRGDHDDNRSSPAGGSLGGLVLSTVLEVNYLTAPLAFLILVIAPALLVGILPSIVVTYGRFLFDIVTHAATGFAALTFFVLLVGAALWM